ncbi:DUF6850 family outer membrane beta-barrel protein [Marinifilum flexuosum]|uniref:DUF6850 domain-containing protein n=1 Tax=Marinifilum flexuosum TaxID=1117708 RepID=A0A419WSY3_9BACT|nr:DUF6850 family outer membrane beta-barrel protein [Marinifilum flexuosum]RKD98555.1 hypothetical protein BXY64_3414 [Marinifilum flexuosum]
MLIQKLKSIFGIVILLNLAASAFAQNRNANAVDFEKELIQIQSGVWDNPAMLSHQYSKSFTDVSLAAKQWKANELHLIEEGDKQSSIDFDAFSFKRLKKSFVYGRASYSKKNTNNIKWNTVSDYEKLAPYVVADTIGGKSYGENYYFEGIYSFIHRKNNYAIQAKYRSAEEYRKLDPRPRTTISDLEIKLGGTRKINSKYTIGLYTGFQDYQQDHEIGARRPGTGIKIYYLRGLGISDENFSTIVTNSKSNSNIYEIKGYSVGTQLLPIGQTGWFQSFSYKKSKLELLKTVGSGYDIVNDLVSKKFEFSLGRQYLLDQKTCKVKAFASYEDKKGREFNYNHNRKLLSVLDKYSESNVSGGISGILFVKKEKYTTFYKTSLTYNYDNLEYKKSTSRNPKQEIEKLRLDLNAGRSFQFNESALNVKLAAVFDYCVGSELMTTSPVAEGANKGLVIPNYDFLSADKFLLGTDIRYDINTKKSYNIYTRLAYHQMMISGSKSQYGINLAIGLTL